MSFPADDGFIADVDELEKIEEIHALLQQLTARSENIVVSLDGFVGRSSENSMTLRCLFEAAPIRLRTLKRETAKLNDTLAKSAETASKISGDVARLDLKRDRLALAISRIRDTIDVSTCVQTLRQALESEDLPLAVDTVHNFNRIRESGLRHTIGEDHSASFSAMTSRLNRLLEDRMASAVESRDRDQIIACAATFDALGRRQHAVSVYSEFLSRSLASSVSQSIGSLAETQSPDQPLDLFACVDALTELFKAVGDLTKHHRLAVVARLGDAFMRELLVVLRRETDSHGSRVFDHFEQMSRLKELSNSLSTLPSQSHSANSHPPASTTTTASSFATGPSTSDIPQILSAIAVMSYRTNLYKQYTVYCGGSGQGILLERRVQELLNYYIGIEEHYMVASVQKATDFHPPPSH